MTTQVLDAHAMIADDKPSSRRIGWLGGLGRLTAVDRELRALCAKLDRELPIAEARADRLMRQYGL